MIDDWWGGRKVRQALPRLWLEHFSGTSWIVERPDGRLAGFVIAFVSQDDPATGYVHLIAAEPNRRRRGLGRALYERAFADLAGRGARRVVAVMWPANRIAVDFHRALGFRVDDGPGSQRLYGTPAFADYDGPGRGSHRVHPGAGRRSGPGHGPGNRSRPGGVVGAIPDEPSRSHALEEPTMIRRLAAAVAALALLLTMTVPVLAGGWAEIVADAQTTTEPPVEGQPLDVGFVVLQHGQTPAGWETATVHFTNASTGQTIDVTATNDRPDGHFVATATLPEAGAWTWKVTLKDLASEQAPIALTVTSRRRPGRDGRRGRAPDRRGPGAGRPHRRGGGVRDRLASPTAASGREGQPSSARSRPGVTCSWRRRPNRATRSGAGTASIHSSQQRLAFGIDEDVGPPQRVLDELEPLGGELGRVPAQLLQVAQDLVVRPAVGVAQEGGIAPDRADRALADATMATASSAVSRAADRVVGHRHAGPLEQLHQEVRPFLER